MGSLNNISKFKNCFGCCVCSIACPTKAINMQINNNGFIQPFVDDSKCISCRKCLNVCSFDGIHDYNPPYNGYAGWSNDSTIRDMSTSGGVVTEISKAGLLRGYKICGAKFDYINNVAKHDIIDNIDKLELFRGSKYIQSFFSEGISKLRKDYKYIVVGTPCQIASLRKFLVVNKFDIENFILIDFFCHGVPSYLMFNKYLEYLDSKIGTLIDISWRNKENGWQDSKTIKARGLNGRYLKSMKNGDLFYSFFLKDRCLSPACYDSCTFKSERSLADIRVGDFWGAIYSNNNLGVNSIISYSKLADKLLHEINIKLVSHPNKTITHAQLCENPKRPYSFKYVSKKLLTPKPLYKIDAVASKIEQIQNIPKLAIYYANRIREIIQNDN